MKYFFCCFAISVYCFANAQTIPLQFNLKTAQQLQATASGADGSYHFITFADSADPHIYTEALSVSYNPDSVYTLSFDYMAPTGLKNFQLYFWPAIFRNKFHKARRFAGNNCV